MPIRIDELSEAQARELLEHLTLLDELKSQNPLDFFFPYEPQKEFFGLGAVKRERLFMAGNQCISADTLIDHPDGTRTPAGGLFERAQPFEVLAWDRDSVIPAKVSHVIRKPQEPMVRVRLRDQQWFDCTLRHRVLSNRGWISVAALIDALSLRETNSGSGRIVHVADVQHSTRTVPGCRSRCSTDCRPYGAQPLPTAAADQDALPYAADVRRHSRSCGRWDGLVARHANNPCRARDRHSSSDVLDRIVDPSAASVNRAAYRSARYKRDSLPIVGRSPAVLSAELRSSLVQHWCPYGQHDLALIDPHNNGSIVDIASIDLITSRDVYDFTVPVFENYIAAGVVHHNTGKSTSGAFETAAHLTGRYPPWWQGKRFDHPTTGWACGQSGQQIRETIQLKLFGMPASEQSITGGLISPSQFKGRTLGHGTGDLFDQVRIEHVSGGISTLSLKSYEQDATKWQGQTCDFIWVDEEPPAKHYSEALARLTGRGIIYVTFTPLAGYSDVVSRFLRETDETKLQDRAVIRMGLKHVEHFTTEEKRQRVEGYSDQEREARENGDPMLGSGAVFTFPQSSLSIGSELDVPLHWAKLWGVDYGVTHPFAASLLAWDRDEDIVYVIATVRMANRRPIDHVTAMRRIAPDVRVAWPHDGNRRESSLDTLTSHYRREGLLMLPTHAAFADGSISTEAGILEMQQRMADGRFRVKAHLGDWWQEYRQYHRVEGKLIKEQDDLMSATRIAIMALRHARPGPIGPGSLYTTRKTIPAIATGVEFDLFA